MDALLEATTVGEQFEEMLNDALSKAQTAPKIRIETTVVLPKVRIDNPLPKSPDSVQCTNKRRRNFIPLEKRRELMGKRMAEEKVLFTLLFIGDLIDRETRSISSSYVILFYSMRPFGLIGVED